MQGKSDISRYSDNLLSGVNMNVLLLGAPIRKNEVDVNESKRR